MKSYEKALVASLATVGVSCALIGGATFALFSSDSTTDIAVTSGKVNITASIENVKAYSYQVIGDETPVEGFVNGGTAIYDEGTNTLEINNITPGDWVEFDIVLTNNSTVDVKYRTSVNTADVNGKELFEALEFTAGDLSFVEGDANVKYTAWTKWTQDEAKEIIVHSKVELPLTVEDNNNEYELQAASCNISFKVEAVQGNANTYDPVVANPDWNGTTIETVGDLMAFRDAVNGGDSFNGKTITLTSNLDLGGIENWEPIAKDVSFQGTFEGDNHTVSNLTVNYPEQDYVGLFGHLNGTVNALNIKNANVAGKYSAAVIAGTIFNYGTISNVKVEDAVVSGNHWVGGIAGYAYGNITGCVVDGLEITCTPDLDGDKYDNGDKVGGIVGYVGEGSYTISGNKVSNATITAYRDLAGIAGYSQVLVTGNTVENVTLVVDRTLADEYVSVKDINLVDYVTSNGKHDSSNTVTNSIINYINCGDYFADKYGTYHVVTVEGLKEFRNQVNDYAHYDGIDKWFFNGKTIVLDADIDLGGEEWEPIGLQVKYNAFFTGIFDGQGHTVSNFKITGDTDKEHYGFFGIVDAKAADAAPEVKNVTFENVTINVNVSENKSYVGVAVGRLGSAHLSPVIKDVTVKGDIVIESNKGFVGGVVGHMGGNASNLTVEANSGSYVRGWYNVGGIMGSTKANLVFTNFKTNIDVEAPDYCYAGAIVGADQGPNTYVDMYATGNVKSPKAANAFAGAIYTAGTTVTNFVYTGSIECDTNFEGFAYGSENATFINCIATITRNGVTTEYKSSDLL